MIQSSQKISEEVPKYNWEQKQLLYLKYYSWCFECNYFHHLPYGYGIVKEEERKRVPVSFDEFCSEQNIKKVIIGDVWKEQGFAQESWIDFNFDSVFWWQLHHPL